VRHAEKSGDILRILVYLVLYDSGQVSLERLVLSWYPSQRYINPGMSSAVLFSDCLVRESNGHLLHGCGVGCDERVRGDEHGCTPRLV